MAYAVHLEQFEGPLDLLLHLISEAELDIKDIFVSEITSQYLAYLSELDNLDMDSASEFVTMAATLLYIKSRQLLPKPDPEPEEGEEDPAELLIRQLKDYQAFKKASETLKGYFEEAQQSFSRLPEDLVLPPKEYDLTGATLTALMDAFSALLSRKVEETPIRETQRVRLDAFTVRGQILRVREALKERESIDFNDLFPLDSERMERIVTFMALLEMLAHGEVHIRQSAPFEPICISAKDLRSEADEEYAHLDDEQPEQ